MLKGKWKLLICIALITCVIFTASNNVFAAINKEYYNNNVVGDEVVDEDIDSKIESSSILDAIGIFIYSIGSLIELLLAKVFQLITGTNMFPWADAILFNAVPFLDANIFTASDHSLVSMLYGLLTGTYYSLLTLASTFFGIAVMYSAIKLAITAIAEDKAKYKKAIVDWILGLVMLWGMHYFISFVLYLNEQMVIVASNIAAEEVAENGSTVEKIIGSASPSDEQMVENFISGMHGVSIGNIFQINDLMDWIEMKLGWSTVITDDDIAECEDHLRKEARIAATLIGSEEYRKAALSGDMGWVGTKKSFWNMVSFPGYICQVSWDVSQVKEKSYSELKEIRDWHVRFLNEHVEWKEYVETYTVLMKIKKQLFSNDDGRVNNNVVKNLAVYFKEASWQAEEKSWSANKISIQNAIMYVIFVCYSLVFFIAYTKRLFYVIMLILMAPIVVVFDFFMKFGK